MPDHAALQSSLTDKVLLGEFPKQEHKFLEKKRPLQFLVKLRTYLHNVNWVSLVIYNQLYNIKKTAVLV